MCSREITSKNYCRHRVRGRLLTLQKTNPKSHETQRKVRINTGRGTERQKDKTYQKVEITKGNQTRVPELVP